MSSAESTTAGAVSQHNSGGVNVANTGTIGTLVVNAATRPPEEPLWMVPPPSGPVVQRPELAEALRDALLSAGDGPVAVTTALEGAGGFGKTTLATDVCLTDQRIHERFAGGLLWVTLGQNATGAELAAKINGVCELLTGQACTVSEPEQAGFRLGALLSQRPDMLLVIDDVWNSAQLAPFLIGAPRCRRLVTTRNATILPRGASSVLVDAMESSEAVQALTQGLSGVPHPMVERLVAVTGRWPVLLSLVNAAMVEYVRQGATVTQAGAWVIERLVAEGPTALDVGDASSRDRAVEVSVQASLDLMSALERERYLDLAIFPEDIAIPSSVLALLWSETGGLSRTAADRLASRLTSLRLASGTWQNGPALKLHDVLRSYLRHRQGAARLAELNQALVDVARSMVPPLPVAPAGGGTAWWLLPDDADYLWRYLAYHLAEAGAETELGDLVCDLRWLLARIERYGPVATGGDLALSGAAAADELRRVLGQEAHLLGRLQPGLADTLLSRIPITHRTERLLSRASLVLKGPRLAPFWPLPDLPDPDLDRTLEGHTGAVRSCAASPDGRWVASAGFDRAIRIWNVTTGSTHRVLHGHTGWIWQCAWTPDGTSLISASDDGTVRVWDLPSGHCRTVLTGHADAVMSCAVSPDGTWLASAGVDGTVRLWDLPSGHCRTVLTGHADAVMSCAVSPDGTWLASAGVDGTVRLWDLPSGHCRTVLTGHNGVVTGCAVAPDGTWIATSGFDGTVRIWDVHSGAERASLTGHAGWVNACAVAPDGTLVVSAGADRTIRVWDPAAGRLGITLFGDTGSANACTIARDASWVAAGGSDNMVRVWRPPWGDSANDGLRRAAAARTHVPRGPAEPIRECAAFPDGSRIVSVGTDGIVRLWDATTATELTARRAHTGVAQCCAVAPDGSWFVSGGYDGLLHLWDLDGQTPRVTLTGHTGWVMRCAVAPDGTLLASGSYDGTVRLWDTADGTPIAVLGGDFGQQYGCAFSGDGTRLASTGSDRLVRLWDVASRTLTATLAGHTARVNNCGFSANGKWLASAGFDGTIRTWDTATGAPLLIIDNDDGGAQWGCAIAISLNDAWIASASSDGVIRIWDAHTGDCRNALRVEQRVRACAWMSDTRLCVAGDAGIYVLDYGAAVAEN